MAVENEPCHLKSEAGQAMPSDPQGGAWDDEGMGGVALCAFFRSLKSHLNSFQLNLRLSMALLAIWRTTLANCFDLQEHVLPSALDMEVEMVADMEMDMVDNKEVHKMMNDVTKDIVGE